MKLNEREKEILNDALLSKIEDYTEAYYEASKYECESAIYIENYIYELEELYRKFRKEVLI